MATNYFDEWVNISNFYIERLGQAANKIATDPSKSLEAICELVDVSDFPDEAKQMLYGRPADVLEKTINQLKTDPTNPIASYATVHQTILQFLSEIAQEAAENDLKNKMGWREHAKAYATAATGLGRDMNELVQKVPLYLIVAYNSGKVDKSAIEKYLSGPQHPQII
ncbi:MAG TPA: hypothetical protein ENG02_00460 [Candidatus Woesearchaeota archaeon]|nr:hypothetical protein [Candidatus Woesearchaeota archaeon]